MNLLMVVVADIDIEIDSMRTAENVNNDFKKHALECGNVVKMDFLKIFFSRKIRLIIKNFQLNKLVNSML